MKLDEILTQPALNGIYRLDGTGDLAPVLDGRSLTDRGSLLAALGRALDFPDYYGQNWDALEECLNDLSWRRGPTLLLIEHADAMPAELLAGLMEIFADAAAAWQARGRVFSLFLSGLRRTDIPTAR